MDVKALSSLGVHVPLPFTKAELQLMLDNIDVYSTEEQAEISKYLDEYERRSRVEEARDDLIAFCRYMMPEYRMGKHHRRLADLLMQIAEEPVRRSDGTLEIGKDRIAVNMPPRHGKSLLVSVYYPAWYLGKYPTKKVMMVSHTTDLAVDFGRKVRNLIDSDRFREIFPGVKLSADSKSAGRWNTNHGGEFYACGIGSSIAGRGADLLLVDDPHSEQDVLAGNFEVFEKAYKWFTLGARTRLMPGGRVAVVQCMTGDTPVLMANGDERPLQDLRVGDKIAAYDLAKGGLTGAEVTNWTSQGLDQTYTIRLASGRLLRANARHPFLVHRAGVERWVRLKNLKPGDTLVSLWDAPAPHGPKQNRASARLASLKTHIIGKTQTHPISPSGITGSGVGKSAAQKIVHVRQNSLRGIVQAVIRKFSHRKNLRRNRTGTDTSDTGTEYPSKNIIKCWTNRVVFALFAGNPPHRAILAPTGVESCALTTATSPIEFERCSATTATSWLGTARTSKPSLPALSTYGPTLDRIVAITAAGVEEVFDIEVTPHANFIANGYVSHNTRWHQDDLTGRLTKDMILNPRADQYEVVEFPAILDVDTPDGVVQKPLWPEFFDLDALARTRASMPPYQWNAQYQQNPTAEEAAIIKREWWRIWRTGAPPECEYKIMTLDAAAEAHNRADFTALTTWGVFWNDTENAYQIILLNVVKERVEFPELKALAMREYKEWKPDAFIVEKKSSGTALYQELRRTGLLVQEYTPARGTSNNPNTKVARLNSVADIIKEGMVWVSEHLWAQDLVEEIAGFPYMSHDDQVDCTIMALMRFRQGGFIRLKTDEVEEELPWRGHRSGAYY